MPKNQNEVLPASVRGDLKDLLNSLSKIADLNAAIQEDAAKNLTDTKVVKAAIQRVRKDLIEISKLCKVSRADATELRKSVDEAKK